MSSQAASGDAEVGVRAPLDSDEPYDAAQQRRRVVLSGVIGTTLEWFDFLLYGLVAPSIFDRIFFPGWSKDAASTAVLVIFGAAYTARPIGAFVFGHFGDRIGRKPMMYASLVLMGAATTALGALPTYASIGVAAPILLCITRSLQGFALGGEGTGALIMAVETGPAEKRGGFTALIQIGGAAGSVTAALAAAAVGRLPEADMLSWGWRVPFLMSSVLVLVGLYVRWKLAESPLFTAAIAGKPPERVPLIAVLRQELKASIVICLCSITSTNMLNIFSVFGLVYAVGHLGVDRATMLSGVFLGNIVGILTNPLYGRLSDLVGRRTVIVSGIAVACVYVPFVFFPLLASPNHWVVLLVATIPPAIIQPIIFSTGASYYAELIRDARLRFTAVGMANSLGGVIAGFFPAIASALLARSGTIWAPISYYEAISVISAVAVLTMRETRRIRL